MGLYTMERVKVINVIILTRIVRTSVTRDQLHWSNDSNPFLGRREMFSKDLN